MHVAVVAPPWFEVPSPTYGGIEWVSYWLVEGLVERGHAVTLVAAGRNHTRGDFVQTYGEPQSDRFGETLVDVIHAARGEAALEKAQPDIVHEQSFVGPLLAFGRKPPTVLTVHGPVQGEIADYYRALQSKVALVAISQSQRAGAPDIAWTAMVHNAVDVGDYPFRSDKDEFVLFLGRMTPEKGAHIAIDVARAAGRDIVLAAKCREAAEHSYFESEIRPRLGKGVDWIGEATTDEKKDLLSAATCLLLPVQWEEPFGVVMVEAMACGTPVVALDRGSVREIVVHGTTGFIHDEPEKLVEAIDDVRLLDPADCREHVVKNFDVDLMVERYTSLYRGLIEDRAER